MLSDERSAHAAETEAREAEEAKVVKLNGSLEIANATIDDLKNSLASHGVLVLAEGGKSIQAGPANHEATAATAHDSSHGAAMDASESKRANSGQAEDDMNEGHSNEANSALIEAIGTLEEHIESGKGDLETLGSWLKEQGSQGPSELRSLSQIIAETIEVASKLPSSHADTTPFPEGVSEDKEKESGVLRDVASRGGVKKEGRRVARRGPEQ